MIRYLFLFLVLAGGRAAAGTLWQRDELLADWLAQDAGLAPREKLDGSNVWSNVGKAFRKHGIAFQKEKAAEQMAAYRAACVRRRATRLERLFKQAPRLVYARHAPVGGSFYAYTEGLSDAQNERNFTPGTRLCLAEARADALWRETVLLDSPGGAVRDADVDFSGNKILFAHKKSDRGDDYHLYVMDARTRAVTQLTRGAGVADYEGCWLPDGSVLFNSTRCMQIVDCWWTEVSNLYRCDADGSGIRRLTFDQVHDNYPAVGPDGRVLYTRWEYNDRSQMFPQILFRMLPDGTRQEAVRGENSWFPTTLIHARMFPGSPRILAVATGHHTWQPGRLAVIDTSKGRDEAAGVEYAAPRAKAEAVRTDFFGQDGALFAYPWPLDETSALVSLLPEGWPAPNGAPQRSRRAVFGLYWVDLVTGARELLVPRAGGPGVGRMVPLAPRARPPAFASTVDRTKDTGTVYVQNVYRGAAAAGLAPGSVKALRVVRLDYRAAGIGMAGNGGPGGGGLSSTPPAISNGTWDPKQILGEVPVEADGSAFFTAPARTPFYFMLLDKDGRMLQTMRSWTMLQPGENASCVGCHESKDTAPPPVDAAAVRRRPHTVSVPPGPFRGFSFPRDVQPVLDRRCAGCHDGRPGRPDLTAAPRPDPMAKRVWTASYLALTHAWKYEPKNDPYGPYRYVGNPNHKSVKWVGSGETVKLLPPNTYGAAASALFTNRLDKGHCPALTPPEKATLAAWVDLGVPFCGDYTEAADWTPAERATYDRALEKRRRFSDGK